MQYADLRFASLEGANFWSANLKSANLTGVYLKRANLVEANLENADLTAAIIEDSILKGNGLNINACRLSLAALRNNEYDDKFLEKLFSAEGIVDADIDSKLKSDLNLKAKNLLKKDLDPEFRERILKTIEAINK
jgi:uncharacterized protein YjbI with pentapeptide repeats